MTAANNRRRPGSIPPPAPAPLEDQADDVGSLDAVEVPTPRAQLPRAANARQSLAPRVEALDDGASLARWKRGFRRAASVAGIALVLSGSVVGGRAAHRWMTHTPRFGAREIEVVGPQHTLRGDILAAARIDIGTNVLGLDSARAERAIERLPWIERAHVTRRLPGFIRVEVQERTPVAIVSAGGLYLTSADGHLFKRMQSGDPDDLPTVTGITRADFDGDAEAARGYVRDALALLSDFSSSSLATRAHIDEVHRDATGDLSIVLAEHGTYVWLGRGPYRAKLARLSAILSELDRQRLVAAEIHLEGDRHPERATVRVPVADDSESTDPSTAPAPTPATASSRPRAASPRH